MKHTKFALGNEINSGGHNRKLLSWILSKCSTGESSRESRVESGVILVLDLAPRWGWLGLRNYTKLPGMILGFQKVIHDFMNDSVPHNSIEEPSTSSKYHLLTPIPDIVQIKIFT